MDLLSYFTRSISILLAFVLLYLLAFRKDGHFTLYRIFLFAGLVSTLFLPLIEISYTVVIQSMGNDQVYKEVAEPVITVSSAMVEHQSSFNWMAFLSVVYLIGVGVMGGRMIWGVIRILRLIRISDRIVIKGVSHYVSKQINEPFTFGHFIFLDDESYFDEINSEILAHENIHLKQNHWIDVMLSEILIIVQWFNPLSWYYGRLVKQNLEFLADRGVLRQGYSIEKYIQSIICVTMGAEASVLANHFRFSQNKRRLKMMKNVRKSKWRQLKLLLTLPLIGGFLWAFSEPVYKINGTQSQYGKTNVQNDSKSFVINGYVGVSDTMMVRDPNTMQFVERIVEAASPLHGTSVVIKGTTKGAIADSNGEFKLEVSKGDVLVFSFVGFKTEERKVEEGKEITVALQPASYAIDPSPFREKYKGKLLPPPPPPAPKSKKKELAPPPPPPTEDDEPVFFIVEDLPKYNGGIEIYAANLYSSITQAKEKQELKGVVKVKFVINAKGDVVDVNAIGKKGNEAEVAEKIVAGLNNWIPGKQRGKPIACTMVVPVEFD
nr:M56 family metallopeptidase [uncultured Carboxylicivirga sp.]